MSETVDRKSETKEQNDGDLVDRVGITEENVEVDRTGSTQEESGTKLTFHVQHPQKKTLLKGLPTEPKTYEVGQTIVFGRGEKVDIFLNDDEVSREHMVLTSVLHETTQQAIFKVKVISKTLSIKVNNFTIRYGGEYCLRTNDVIVIGHLKFTTEIISGYESSCYLLEFNQDSPQSPVQMVQPYGPHFPNAQVFQYQPPIHTGYIPVQIPQYHPQIPDPNLVQMPFVPGYSGLPAVPIAGPGCLPPAPVPITLMQPIPPPHGVHSYQMQTSPPYSQLETSNVFSQPFELQSGQTARREAFLQNSPRIPSENEDDRFNMFSIDETQPKTFSSLEESFEDTHPPKQ